MVKRDEVRCRAAVVGVAASALMAGAMAFGTSPAWAGQIASKRLVAHLVAPSAAASRASAPRAFHPLGIREPAQFAAAKAAADRAYATWAATHPSASPSASPLLTSTLSSSIAGLNKPGGTASQAGGQTPPDTTGAIGPASYLEFLNSLLAVYSRTLASPPVASATEDAFTGSTKTCDGQIKWDQAARRFEYYSLDCAAALGSEGFSFGWSKTSSPTPLTGTSANWCKYHINTGTKLEDYGKLGNSNSWLIVGSNEFNDATLGYLDSPIFVIAKPANGSATCPASPTITKFIPTAANEFTPEPANVFGSSSTGFIVAINPTTSAAIRMYTVTGTTTPTLTDKGNITVPAFNVPATVPQPGTSDRLDSMDTRLTQATAAVDPSVKAVTVWTQHTVAGPKGGPSVVRWYELKSGSTSPLQTGTVSVSGAFAFNGAIAPTKAGNAAAINYDVGSSTVNVQIRAQIHSAGSTAGSTSGEAVLVSSPGINQDFSCPSQTLPSSASCRWGDYAGASTDPNGCGNTAWGTNEFNGTTSVGHASWASENFSLITDECPTAAFTFSPTSPSAGQLVSFDGSTSADPDGTLSYTWNWGDGTPNSTGVTATHTFATAGTMKVILTVRDDVNQAASISHTITVG